MTKPQNWNQGCIFNFMSSADVIKAALMSPSDLDRTFDRMARQIVEHLDPNSDSANRLGLIGLQTRGVFIARRLRDRIQKITGEVLPFGVLDSTLYRDDFRTRHQPVVKVTDVPFDVQGRRIVLVDDVLYTGRSVRAAIDAIMDLGRPARIHFLTLIDRGLRELPIRADIVGMKVPTTSGEEVRVRLKEFDEEDGVWLVNVPKPVSKLAKTS